LVTGLETWFNGEDITFDYAQLRPAGARLMTMGGKSSGPEPLRNLLDFAREKIMKRQGRRLSNLDVHDLVCKIGEVVVSGGVRRSALISLSDLDDYEMRHAKDGQFYVTEPQRMMANNSAVYTTKPSTAEFMDEWISLMKSGSGERGIFNRGSLEKQIPERRKKTLMKDVDTTGTNPCGEIILKSKQFCNLTEVVIRSEDTKATLMKKMRLAAILGTYQSTLTNFKYLSKEWQKNCEEERLLGVSITGQWDNPALVHDPKVLADLRDEAVAVNKQYAKRFGINQSTAVTAVKPSGTVSQLNPIELKSFSIVEREDDRLADGLDQHRLGLRGVLWATRAQGADQCRVSGHQGLLRGCSTGIGGSSVRETTSDQRADIRREERSGVVCCEGRSVAM
jgi:ribonucleoside-diphosphate reductase alpha chain